MIQVIFYKRFRNWRWRIVAANYETIGASTEGYKNREDAVANFSTITSRVIVRGNSTATLFGQPEWEVHGLELD